MKAEQSVKRILRVKTLVDDVKINLSLPVTRNDIDISNSVTKALKENWAVPYHRIKVIVEHGWVTLEGILYWNFQRKSADNAIRYLEGVRGVTDKIKIEVEIKIKNELRQETLKKALSDSWILKVDNVKVRVDGKTIFLSGIVSSLFQKEEVEKIAWNTLGVWYVDNELLVEFD